VAVPAAGGTSSIMAAVPAGYAVISSTLGLAAAWHPAILAAFRAGRPASSHGEERRFIALPKYSTH